MFGSKRTKALEQELATVRSELEQIQVENFTLESAEAFDLFTMGNLASAGTYVTEKTAMSVGAVFACVRLIAGAIAGLPLPIDLSDHQRGARQSSAPIPLVAEQ